MSYYASGCGEVILKSEVPEDILALLKESAFMVYPLAHSNGLGIEFDYGKYYDDEANDCMNAIAPYVARGDVEFTGEDGQFRFHFDDGTVIEENAEYFYPSDMKKRKAKRKVIVTYAAGDNYEIVRTVIAEIENGKLEDMYRSLQEQISEHLRKEHSKTHWLPVIEMIEETEYVGDVMVEDATATGTKCAKRTFTVRYYHSEGANESQFDIDDKDFVDMMNELLALTYQVADESGEHNVEIYEIEEVPYDGEED